MSNSSHMRSAHGSVVVSRSALWYSPPLFGCRISQTRSSSGMAIRRTASSCGRIGNSAGTPRLCTVFVTAVIAVRLGWVYWTPWPSSGKPWAMRPEHGVSSFRTRCVATHVVYCRANEDYAGRGRNATSEGSWWRRASVPGNDRERQCVDGGLAIAVAYGSCC